VKFLAFLPIVEYLIFNHLMMREKMALLVGFIYLICLIGLICVCRSAYVIFCLPLRNPASIALRRRNNAIRKNW